jgi:hypothetical protein
MENRIQINGFWYVLETPEHKTPITYEINEESIAYSQSATYENDKYCFEASRIYRDINSDYFYDDCLVVTFTDKRSGDRKDWTDELWDGISWFNGLIERNYESIETARESMCHEGVETFISFLKILKNKGWL